MQRIGFSIHKTVRAYINKRRQESLYDTFRATFSSHSAEKSLVRRTPLLVNSTTHEIDPPLFKNNFRDDAAKEPERPTWRRESNPFLVLD
jgi:hypothetical protein